MHILLFRGVDGSAVLLVPAPDYAGWKLAGAQPAMLFAPKHKNLGSKRGNTARSDCVSLPRSSQDIWGRLKKHGSSATIMEIIANHFYSLFQASLEGFS